MSGILKLTDTHLLLMSAAAQRPDGLLNLASHLKGANLRAETHRRADYRSPCMSACVIMTNILHACVIFSRKTASRLPDQAYFNALQPNPVVA